MKAHPDLLQSNLWQIPVPESCIGKTYEHLFNALLDRKLVTMALYRLPLGSLRGVINGSESPYVVTNPEAETPITHRDRAFVLGIEVPVDLQGDIYEMMEKQGSLQLTLNSTAGSVATGAGAASSGEGADLGGGSGTNKAAFDRMKAPPVLPPDSSRGGAGAGPTGNGLSSVMPTMSNPMQDANKRFIQNHEDKNEQAIFGIRASKNQSNQVQSVARKLESSVRTIENIVDKLRLQVMDQDHLIKSTISTITQDYLDKYRVTEDEGVENGGTSKAAGGNGASNGQGTTTGYASDRQNADAGL